MAVEGRPSTETSATGRDALGAFFFYLHFAILVFIVLGWLVPFRPALLSYEVFLPALTIQWWLNKNSCLLNNLESFIRTGQWRSPSNPEEGAWLAGLARSTIGLELTALQVDILTYAVMACLWGLGLWHLHGW